MLFFAKNVRRFLPQAYVTCLPGKGRDKVHILDRKDFAGGVVEDIEDGLRFIERNTRLEYKIEKLKREEIPEYPMAALREAITNAVMHSLCKALHNLCSGQRSLHFFLSAACREKKVPFVAPMPMTAWFAMLMPGAK